MASPQDDQAAIAAFRAPSSFEGCWDPLREVQRNLPGELQRLNEVFARHDVNIAAQTYQTDGEIGYVVLEAEGAVDEADKILGDIRELPGTIRARLLNRVA